MHPSRGRHHVIADIAAATSDILNVVTSVMADIAAAEAGGASPMHTGISCSLKCWRFVVHPSVQN